MTCVANRRGGQVFTGAAFLGVGLLLLLGNLRLLDMRMFLYRWWPVILLAIGIKQLIFMRGAAAWVGGLFWMGTGALFLASTQGYIQMPLTRVIWPLMLIWFGVLVALGDSWGCRSNQFYGNNGVDDGSKS